MVLLVNCNQGDDAPPPFTSFDATGFPSELLREVWIPSFLCNYALASSFNVCLLDYVIWVFPVIAGGLLSSFRTHVRFFPFVLCLRCDICSREELNVVRCSTLFGGLVYIRIALIRWTNSKKGFPNHPSSWLRLPLVMVQSATWYLFWGPCIYSERRYSVDQL